MIALLLMLLCLLLMLSLWTAWGQFRIHRKHPPVGDFITCDGIKLHYVMAGHGPGIIFVHGANSNLHEFTIRMLPALAEKYCVIAFDRPGFGYSERPAGQWLDPAKQADILLNAAKLLGVSQPLIVGHSWGGCVVNAALVHHYTSVIGGVSLSGVSGHWASQLSWAYRLGAIPVIRHIFAWTLLYPVGHKLLESGLTDVFAPNPVSPMQSQKAALALALRPHTYLANVQDVNLSNEFMQALSVHYDQIKLPLLIIHGENDELVPYWNHGRRLLPVVPQAKALLLPNTGHAPHHAHAERVIDEIDQFYQAILTSSLRKL